MGTAEIVGNFADIGAAASLAVLRSRLANRGVHYELSDIDAAAIRLTAPRGFTQEVSRFVYECRDEDGGSLDGIHYLSRLDDATSNWAIFEPASSSPSPLRAFSTELVRPDDPDFLHAVALLGLKVA